MGFEIWLNDPRLTDLLAYGDIGLSALAVFTAARGIAGFAPGAVIPDHINTLRTSFAAGNVASGAALIQMALAGFVPGGLAGIRLNQEELNALVEIGVSGIAALAAFVRERGAVGFEDGARLTLDQINTLRTDFLAGNVDSMHALIEMTRVGLGIEGGLAGITLNQEEANAMIANGVSSRIALAAFAELRRRAGFEDGVQLTQDQINTLRTDFLAGNVVSMLVLMQMVRFGFALGGLAGLTLNQAQVTVLLAYGSNRLSALAAFAAARGRVGFADDVRLTPDQINTLQTGFRAGNVFSMLVLAQMVRFGFAPGGLAGLTLNQAQVNYLLAHGDIGGLSALVAFAAERGLAGFEDDVRLTPDQINTLRTDCLAGNGASGAALIEMTRVGLGIEGGLAALTLNQAQVTALFAYGDIGRAALAGFAAARGRVGFADDVRLTVVQITALRYAFQAANGASIAALSLMTWVGLAPRGLEPDRWGEPALNYARLTGLLAYGDIGLSALAVFAAERGAAGFAPGAVTPDHINTLRTDFETGNGASVAALIQMTRVGLAPGGLAGITLNQARLNALVEIGVPGLSALAAFVRVRGAAGFADGVQLTLDQINTLRTDFLAGNVDSMHALVEMTRVGQGIEGGLAALRLTQEMVNDMIANGVSSRIALAAFLEELGVDGLAPGVQLTQAQTVNLLSALSGNHLSSLVGSPQGLAWFNSLFDPNTVARDFLLARLNALNPNGELRWPHVVDMLRANWQQLVDPDGQGANFLNALALNPTTVGAVSRAIGDLGNDIYEEFSHALIQIAPALLNRIAEVVQVTGLNFSNLSGPDLGPLILEAPSVLGEALPEDAQSIPAAAFAELTADLLARLANDAPDFLNLLAPAQAQSIPAAAFAELTDNQRLYFATHAAVLAVFMNNMNQQQRDALNNVVVHDDLAMAGNADMINQAVVSGLVPQTLNPDDSVMSQQWAGDLHELKTLIATGYQGEVVTGNTWTQGSTITVSAAGFDEAQQQALNEVLSLYASITGLTFQQVDSDGQISIDFGVLHAQTAGALGLTSQITQNGQILAAQITLEDPAEMSLVNGVYAGTDVTFAQLLTHEIGHALGLSDNNLAGSNANFYLDATNRALSQADIEALQWLYGQVTNGTVVVQTEGGLDKLLAAMSQAGTDNFSVTTATGVFNVSYGNGPVITLATQ